MKEIEGFNFEDAGLTWIEQGCNSHWGLRKTYVPSYEDEYKIKYLGAYGELYVETYPWTSYQYILLHWQVRDMRDIGHIKENWVFHRVQVRTQTELCALMMIFNNYLFIE